MELRGVDRIVVAVKNFEESKAIYTAALGATWHDASWTGEELGIEVAISWDAGIELIAPLPGREDDSIVSGFLSDHGDGIMNVVFGVSDAAKAKNKTAAAGLDALHSLDYARDDLDLHLDGLFSKYEEHILNSAEQCGFTMTIAQIDPK
jgi:catechol 2,3-dioxygenase-like lactoylglutathione lyase family enzyme